MYNDDASVTLELIRSLASIGTKEVYESIYPFLTGIMLYYDLGDYYQDYLFYFDEDIQKEISTILQQAGIKPDIYTAIRLLFKKLFLLKFTDQPSKKYKTKNLRFTPSRVCVGSTGCMLSKAIKIDNKIS